MDEKFNRIPVSVIHLDKDGTVIDVEDYNLDKVEPDLWAIKGLAAPRHSRVLYARRKCSSI
jgi:hypothetical protein